MNRALALAARLSLAVLMVPVAGLSAEASEPAPIQRSLELGADFARYSDGIEDEVNGQFLRYSQGRENRYDWRAEIGRAEAFGERSFNYGASYTRHLPHAWSLSAGLSSGTGEIIAPEYRLDMAVGHGFLAGHNLVATLGYTRIQSKGENRSDGLGLEIVHYAHAHWIYSLMGRFDEGQPGDTESFLGGASLTFVQYRRTYITAGVEFGDISYMLVSETEALVNFYSRGYSLLLSQWLTDRSGFNLKASYTDTDDYLLRGIAFSVFREF